MTIYNSYTPCCFFMAIAIVCSYWECDSAQERSQLRLKWPNRISNYIVIHFIHTQRNHCVKMASLQKIHGFVFQVNLSITKWSTL